MVTLFIVQLLQRPDLLGTPANGGGNQRCGPYVRFGRHRVVPATCWTEIGVSA